MNWPYIHTLVNHFPIILSVVGSGVLLLALITRRRGLWLYALATLTLAGLAAYPAFFSGDQASHAVRNTWYIERSMVREHDAAAGYALWTLLIAGAMSAYAWWRMLRVNGDILPRGWIQAAVTVLALFSLSVVVRTAYLGGQIVHDAPKLKVQPVGVDTTRH